MNAEVAFIYAPDVDYGAAVGQVQGPDDEAPGRAAIHYASEPLTVDAGQGKLIFEQAVLPLKLEGLVAKRLDSVYQPGIRSGDWVRVKRKGAAPAERFKRGERT